ncbi:MULTISPECIES: FG-GAP-like repeat-containing protein [unclassified Arthrobacter]|uniref:FG-GAP-like repeat-containing protein n=1 Tax=unclassified Arthrobacter TaxID=235627 RepID=UPI0015E3D764|nr:MULTISPECIES: FG-GAP-like repeat-containing protein [unclassified Arthrobacter]
MTTLSGMRYARTSFRILMATLLCAALAITVPPPRAMAAGPEVPLPTVVSRTSPATVVPGNTISLSFTLSGPAQQVGFTYINEDTLEQATLYGPTSQAPGPYSAQANVPVNGSAFTRTGRYKLLSVDIVLTSGNGSVRYGRDGNVLFLSQGLEAPTQRPGALDAVDFAVNNPNFPLVDNPNTTPPTVTGVARYDQVLTTDNGAWTYPPTGFAYQWLRNGQPIPGATLNTYRVAEADLDQTLSARVTATRAGYRAVSSSSLPLTPTSTITATAPTLQGKLTVGEQLTGVFNEGSVATGTPGGAVSIRYEWVRNGTVISGATAKNYTLAAADRGAVVGFRAVVQAGDPATATRPFTVYGRTVVRNKAHTAGFDAGTSLDLFARNASANLLLYPTDGAGRWQAARTIGYGWDVFDLVFSAGDFNGDGNNDVIARDDAGTLFLYPGNGTGGWLPRAEIGWGWDIFNSVFAAGDFSGDGNNDLLARTPSGALVLYPGNGAGGFRSPGAVGQGWAALSQVFSPGDFDGDGNPDVMGRDDAGNLRLYGGNGQGGWTTARGIGTGWNVMSRIGGAGDFNGDGINDVWAIDSAAQLNMYYGNGSGGWKGAGVVGWGWGGFTAVF